MSIRDDFVLEFGEAEALSLEAAADEHSNGAWSSNTIPNKGSDPFKWVLLICIVYECASKDEYRKYHGIHTPWESLKRWIINCADLAHHDGDCYFLSLAAGVYYEFISKENINQENANG